MKIALIGYSGSGKSTLARHLAEKNHNYFMNAFVIPSERSESRDLGSFAAWSIIGRFFRALRLAGMTRICNNSNRQGVKHNGRI